MSSSTVLTDPGTCRLRVEHSHDTAAAHTAATLLVRRHDHAEHGEVADIHLTLRDAPRGQRFTKWRSMAQSVFLPPAQARALALALCPELVPLLQALAHGTADRMSAVNADAILKSRVSS